MNRAGNSNTEWNNTNQKRNIAHFLSFVDVSFEFSDMYISFWIPIGVTLLNTTEQAVDQPNNQ